MYKKSLFEYLVKMEYLSKVTIFGLKMMGKSGQEKILLKFLHGEAISFYFIDRRLFL